MLAVERHYLVTHGGGFVENFYGLKREKALPVGEIPRANIGTFIWLWDHEYESCGRISGNA